MRKSVSDQQPTSHSLPAGEPGLLAPARVLCTDRLGGSSTGPFADNNLGLHVDDVAAVVRANRVALVKRCGVHHIQWLDQVHGTQVHLATAAAATVTTPEADAVWTSTRGLALAILTADCAPVVLVDDAGDLVAAAHAGWRGLCAGVLRELVHELPVPVERLQAFIGPTIGPSAFEVGAEVIQGLADYGIEPTAVSVAGQAGKFHVDLVAACRFDLARLGVRRCAGGHWCTATQERFFSWRRETHRARAAGEPPATGRQATLVWLPDRSEAA